MVLNKQSYFELGKEELISALLESHARQTDSKVNNALLRELIQKYVAMNKKLIESEKELKRIAVTDPLTGVYNRKKLLEVLDVEMKRTTRYLTPMSLLMFDIDHFKQVNDTYGHERGDYTLVTIVELVGREVRDTDLIARWGGEEFMILLPNTTEEDGFYLAERIRRSVEKFAFEKVGKVTCSFGITEYMPNESEASLLKRLDDALYRAKAEGRNRVVSG